MSYVIYGNNQNGAISFSKEFIMELFRRYPGDISLFGNLTEECPIYNYKEPPCPHLEMRAGWAHVGPDLDFLQTDSGLWLSIDVDRFSKLEIRNDKRIVDLIRERGIRWSSSKYSKIGIAYIPPWCVYKILPTKPERVVWSIPKDKIINSLLGLTFDSDLHPLAKKMKDANMTIEAMEEELSDTAKIISARISREFDHN